MHLLHVKSLYVLLVTLCVLWHVEVDAGDGLLLTRGCYVDRSGSRAMPELLVSYRGNGLDWSDLDNTVIIPCREEAEKRNYKCFGIQFYGECWSGPNACDTYDKYGKSDECFCSVGGSSGKSYPRYDPEHEHCLGPVGGSLANFVYKID
ncbi:uncharacterized protein LOC111328661 [Stylophora pistillata]|nr:uncharacterized protein LOC111328661 [Stylophora pistillata]